MSEVSFNYVLSSVESPRISMDLEQDLPNCVAFVAFASLKLEFTMFCIVSGWGSLHVVRPIKGRSGSVEVPPA
jgi:hypothetical protein